MSLKKLITLENLQSFYNKLPSWSKNSTKPEYNYSEINNTPTLGTAASKDVAAGGGNAGNNEVVMGNDSRLTNSRNPLAHNQASSTIDSMASYSKPSSAPATPAIQMSDSLNTAIGKLEYKVDVQNSSLVEVVDKGAKNIFDFVSDNGGVEYTPTTVSGLTCVRNADGTFRITGTPSTTGNITFGLYTVAASNLRKYNDCSISGSSAVSGSVNWAVFAFELSQSPYTSFGSSSNGVAGTINNIPNDSSLVTCYLRVVCANTTTAIDLTFKPMICTKSQFGISPAYVPHAESNAVLTQKVKELEHTDNIFGYHINPNESDPYEAVTYVANARGMVPAKMTGGGFSYGSWGSAFFLPRPCVLNFDGTVAYYLDPNDYSKKIDGTAATIDRSNTTGNVMLEFPKIWVKRVPGTADGERTVYIADRKVDSDYKCFSNINSQNTEINKFYIHAYDGTIHSSQMRSLSGVTLNSTYAPNYTARQEILAAKANNPSGSNVMWFTDTWSDIMLLFDLLYLMGKSLDVQRTFGQGLSGGSETAMRAYVTGSLNNKGLFWGDTTGTNMAVKVLGIENLWGCRWNRIAGMINVAGNLKVKMTYGTADGSTATEYEMPLDSTDATANLTGAGYLDYGTILKSNGYVSQIQADNSKGYKITSVTGGADNKYYCDYYYQASAANTKYYTLLGGSSGYGADCGFSVSLSCGAAFAPWYIGGALSCKP